MVSAKTKVINPQGMHMRPAQVFVNEMAKHGIKLVYINPNECQDQFADLMALTGGKGYDDIFVYAPSALWRRWPTNCWALTAA